MNRMARSLMIAVVLLGAGLAGAYFSAKRFQPTAMASETSSTLFQQKFPDASGKDFHLSDYKGKIIVVNFWATWCVPCVEEIPEFSRLQAEYGTKNVQFVGIGIDNATNIAEFQKKITASYPLLVAGATGSDLLSQFGNKVGGLPYTMVFDASGTVRASKLGRVKEDELRAWLKPLT